MGLLYIWRKHMSDPMNRREVLSEDKEVTVHLALPIIIPAGTEIVCYDDGSFNCPEAEKNSNDQ
jgi:hypothetical protein